MHILTYETLDETRQKTLNEVAARIDQDPNEILREVPFAIALYGRFINPKVIGGYLKRLVSESGEKLTPNQVIEQQMKDDISTDPSFAQKAKIGLDNWFAKRIFENLGVTSIDEFVDLNTGNIKDVAKLASALASNPDEAQKRELLSLCEGPELMSIKLQLGPEFEELKVASGHEETQTEAELVGAGGGVEEAS